MSAASPADTTAATAQAPAPAASAPAPAAAAPAPAPAATASPAATDKDAKELAGPKVIVLGGGGFIGRNVVKYLVDHKLAGRIRVADKTPVGVQNPLSEEHKKAFDTKPPVEFMQADLAKDTFVDKVFGKDIKWDYVINCCGETRFNQKDDDFKLRTLEPAVKCAKAAVKFGVKKFVEISHAGVYDGNSKPVNEKGKISPWTTQAKYRRKAEEELGKIAGLPLVILRPAIVYGPGDVANLSPRLAVAAVYQKLPKEPMKFLWGKDLKLNTVHVEDVARAAWLAATEFPTGSVFNLADETNLDQGKLNTWLGTMFGVKLDFFNSVSSTVLPKDAVATSANEKHIPIWHNLLVESKITNGSAISPYIDAELLGGTDLCIDGTKIAKETKFKAYEHPKITPQEILTQIELLQKMRLFPQVNLVKTGF